jgi:hypothetical protein
MACPRLGGVQFRNVFASEFGTGGSSSFESMSGSLSPQNWGLHGGMAADSCDSPTKCLGERPSARDSDPR